MSEYGDSVQKTKQKLDTVSPTFCLAKWNMVSMHLTNGKTHSCYHPPTHDIPLEGLSENPGLLHNTPQKIEERAMMRRGERPKGCSYCWRIEDAGHTSDRHYRSSEWWNSPDLEKIAFNKKMDTSITPAYVEVNFNQACNFKCIYCSPHLSTTWQEESEKYGPYILKDAAHNDLGALTSYGLMPTKISQKENPYVEAFWKWWPDLYKELKVFRMTGGEPLMDNNTFKVLDYVYENPNKNLELSITSNLCPPDQKLFDKFITKMKRLENVKHTVECYVEDPQDRTPWQSWKNYIIGADMKEYHNSDLPSIERNEIKQTFTRIGKCVDLDNSSYTYTYDYEDKAYKHFSLFVSCDSVGKQAEYIRTGMNFDLLDKNVRRFLRETNGTNITVINTFNILSIPNLKGFLQWILDLRGEFGDERIWFDIPILHTPSWLSIKNADTEMIKNVGDCVEFMNDNVLETGGFKTYEIDKVQRDLDIMRQGKNPRELNIDMTRFAQYVDELDRRRGTNFKETFPELIDFYERCKK